MEYRCAFGAAPAVVRRFLKLPGQLYDKKTYVQDVKLERELLEGRHVLSHYFSFVPVVAVDAAGKTAARCALTFYEGDERAYIGFFECIRDPDAASALFAAAEKLARRYKRTKLTGPLNASFWIGYRLKLNHFQTVYTSEPYNKEYYAAMWQAAGFAVTDRYCSNAFRVPVREDQSLKCRDRLRMFAGAGYRFVMPAKATFDRDLKEICRLLMRSYAHFPMFKEIREDEFVRMFKGLRYVLDYDMVKLARKDGGLAGFFVCVPDYANLSHQSVTVGNLLRMLRIRRSRNKAYVLLYLGIDPAHPGLGSALSELVKRELVRKGARSISALIHEGKITGRLYRELAEETYEYALFERRI